MRAALVELFEAYDAAHQDPWTRRTHQLAIPLIAFHLVAMFDWIRVAELPGGFVLTMAHPGMLAVSVWSLVMSPKLGVLMAAALIGLLALGAVTPWWIVVIAAILGWTVQLLGHVLFEKNKPAFTDNMVQTLVGPLFFLAELTGDRRRSVARR